MKCALKVTEPPWRILFFGTDRFSLTTLHALHQHMVMADSKTLISELHLAHPVYPKPTVVETYGKLIGLKRLIWPIEKSQVHGKYDVGVLSSFGDMVPNRIIEAFPYGIMKVHPSLLPKWRGAAPLHHTILNGDSNTGVSIMKIRPNRYDHGEILAQKRICLSHIPAVSTLREHLGQEGGQMVINVLRDLPDVFNNAKVQSVDGFSYAHKMTGENYWLDWENHTAEQIDCQYRALFETMPLKTLWKGECVWLMDKKEPTFQPSVDLDDVNKAGSVVFDEVNNLIWIKCKSGWVAFSNVSMSKRRVMDAKAFNTGHLLKKENKNVCFRSNSNNLFDETYSECISRPKLIINQK